MLSFLWTNPLETFAVVTGAVSVWLLAHNKVAGWFVALASVAAFGWVFYQVKLYGEVGIQTFYFFTSLQAIWLWMRGGADRQERPVRRVPGRLVLPTLVVALLAFFFLRWLMVELGGALPFWDALTTVMSLVAHVYLMGRWVESWWIWIAVDVIYIPLYLSRGLELTAGLYVFYLLLSIQGLVTFRRLVREGGGSASPDA